MRCVMMVLDARTVVWFCVQAIVCGFPGPFDAMTEQKAVKLGTGCETSLRQMHFHCFTRVYSFPLNHSSEYLGVASFLLRKMPQFFFCGKQLYRLNKPSQVQEKPRGRLLRPCQGFYMAMEPQRHRKSCFLRKSSGKKRNKRHRAKTKSPGSFLKCGKATFVSFHLP